MKQVSRLVTWNEAFNTDFDWSLSTGSLYLGVPFVEKFVNDNGHRFDIVIQGLGFRWRSSRRISWQVACRLAKKHGYRGSNHDEMMKLFVRNGAAV